MCGIAGAVRTSPGARSSGGPRERRPLAALARVVSAISEAQRHRGPDGCGLWHSAGQEVVLGHRRLSILDLSEAAAQPMVDPDTGCAVSFNGEIYNFTRLRRDLEAEGESFRSTGDTEVVLKAYKRWGIEAVSRFRGIFALALWDPGAGVVHLVRDHMGIKPLYWTRWRDPDTGETAVLFASEVRALLASGAVARRLDPAAVASYLWQGFVVGPQTIVDGVHLLPAAAVLTVGPGAGDVPAPRERPYWRIPAAAPTRTAEDDLRRTLVETVGMQLVADVPVGVFLSGGVDSSAVAALAGEAAPGALHTFTIGFEVPGYDERRHAEAVAAAVGSRHRAVVLTEQAFQQQLPAAFAAIDQPTFDGLNTYFVSRAAREAGITVALAGTGGDEMFGGYRSFVEIPRMVRAAARVPFARAGSPIRPLAEEAVGAVAGLASRLWWDVLRVAPPQTRWAKLADVARAAGDVLGLYQVSYALFTRESQAALAGGAVRAAQRRHRHGLPAEVAAAWRERVHASELRQAVSVLELSSFVGERLLRDTDAASMAVALEVRVPLLDPVLAATVAGLDPARRFSPAGRKQALRDAALARLDPALFDRPKSGFVLPIDHWARRRLQPQMDAVFADEGLARRAGLRGEAVRTLWRSFTAGRRGLYWSRVWAIYVLLSWCRTHDMAVAA